MDDITENFVIECCSLFLINMRKIQLESGLWMDGYNYKKESKMFNAFYL